MCKLILECNQSYIWTMGRVLGGSKAQRRLGQEVEKGTPGNYHIPESDLL